MESMTFLVWLMPLMVCDDAGLSVFGFALIGVDAALCLEGLEAAAGEDVFVIVAPGITTEVEDILAIHGINAR